MNFFKGIYESIWDMGASMFSALYRLILIGAKSRWHTQTMPVRGLHFFLPNSKKNFLFFYFFE